MAKDKHKDKNSDDMVLKPDLNITFGKKASLKRSEETGIPLEDEMVIALMEGDTHEAAVDTDLATAYAGTISRPDKSITYPDPESLKKKIVLIPQAARFAAAAVILLLVSIGAWFTFSPASSPDREQYILASLNTKPTLLERTNIIYIKIKGNNQESSMITAREEYSLYAIAKKDSDPIQVQYTMSITDEMSEIYPPNTKHLTPNTLDYAQSEPKKRTLVGKVFNGMFNRVKAPFERSEAQAKPGPEKKFSIWDIAELGIKSVNTLGDNDYTLVRNYDEKGKVKGVIILDE
jgi:hypothetical protein